MRWVLRLFLLIVFSIGLVLGFVYPWAAENMPGYRVGAFRVYDRDAGYVPAEVRAAPSEQPLWFALEVRSPERIDEPDDVIALTMTISTAGRTISAQTYTLHGITPREPGPQSDKWLYRLEPVRVLDVEDAPYRVVVGPGEDEFPIASVQLIVSAGAIDIDPSVPVVGYVIMAIAGLPFLLTFRRRKPRPQDGLPPRWGRQ